MLYYRLYFMTAAGRIRRFAEFDAPHDEAAITLAAEHAGEQPLELWCEKRMVRRFAAAAEAPAATRFAAG